MPAESLNHRTLAELAAAGVVRAARVMCQGSAWGVMIEYGAIERPLAAQRGKARLFRRLETVVAYLRGIGIERFDVDAANYDPARTGRARPDRAAALKRAHRAAAYDKWFRAEVRESLDDPRASIPHDRVSARWSRKRVQLARKAGGPRGARD